MVGDVSIQTGGNCRLMETGSARFIGKTARDSGIGDEHKRTRAPAAGTINCHHIIHHRGIGGRVAARRERVNFSCEGLNEYQMLRDGVKPCRAGGKGGSPDVVASAMS